MNWNDKTKKLHSLVIEPFSVDLEECFESSSYWTKPSQPDCNSLAEADTFSCNISRSFMDFMMLCIQPRFPWAFGEEKKKTAHIITDPLPYSTVGIRFSTLNVCRQKALFLFHLMIELGNFQASGNILHIVEGYLKRCFRKGVSANLHCSI